MPQILKAESIDELFKKRHSASHVLAQAVLEFFPTAQLGIGPATEEGFYYDFELPRPLAPEDLNKIEQRMREIIEEGHELEYQEITIEEAMNLFKNQKFKIELINDLVQRNEKLSIYRHGTFYDLCKGPHTTSLRNLNPQGIKILNLSGAYWRGDEKREMLQRIYATYFDSIKELEQYLHRLKEAQKYDHKNLGRELKLFTVSSEVGSGLIIWLPKGIILRNKVEEYLKELTSSSGYQFVSTPHVGRGELWKISGHLDHYKENMFPEMKLENESYFVKPMNCPFHIQVYKELVQSFRDLPLRLAEFGTVYRYEKSGTLNGLTRVRGFTQDDGHIFCAENHLGQELANLIEMAIKALHKFEFKNYKVFVSTRPEESVGDPIIWEKSEKILMEELDKKNIYYYLDQGGGAFYGPKIDLKVDDSLGREWQLSTIQLDFNLPHKFNLSFVDSDGKKKTPIMIHRAIFGSLERFVGVLIEHFKGVIPFWLAPEQIRIIPVSEKINQYALDVFNAFYSFRCTVDLDSERLAYKIRKAEIEKVPYIIVVGLKEQENSTVTLRGKTEGDMGIHKIDDLIKFFSDKNKQ